MATIGQLLKRAGHGAKSLGQAVHAAATGVTQPQNPAAASGGPVEMLDAQPTMPDFSLPNIGEKPDINDPKYNTDNSPAGGYEQDLADWNHKQEIHNAMLELDRIYQEAHPQRDFKGEYQQELAALGKDPGYAPEGSFLKRFALSLGDFNPAVQQTGKSNLSEADKRQATYDEKKRQLMRQMTEKKAADAEARGNFSTALKQQEQLQLMDYEKERRTQADKVALETQKADAAKERAQIRAEGARRAAEIVASHRYPQGTDPYNKLVEKLVTQYAERFGNTNITSAPGMDLNTLFDTMHQLDLELHPDKKEGDGEAERRSNRGYHVGGGSGNTKPAATETIPVATPTTNAQPKPKRRWDQ
jgi:hypothetical protein